MKSLIYVLSLAFIHGFINGQITTEQVTYTYQIAYCVGSVDATWTITAEAKNCVNDYLLVNSIHAQPKSNYTLYPNPTTDILIIKSEEKILNEIILYNSEGKEIKKYYINGQKERKINFNLLPKGLYYVEINGFCHSIIKK